MSSIDALFSSSHEAAGARLRVNWASISGRNPRDEILACLQKSRAPDTFTWHGPSIGNGPRDTPAAEDIPTNHSLHISLRLRGAEDQDGSAEDEYSIYVRMLTHPGHTPVIELRVRPSTTLLEVKKIVEKKTGLRVDNQRLRYGSWIVGDEGHHHLPLSAYSMPRGATLQARVGPSLEEPFYWDWIWVRVKPGTGEELEFRVSDAKWKGSCAQFIEETMSMPDFEWMEVAFAREKEHMFEWLRSLRKRGFVGPKYSSGKDGLGFPNSSSCGHVRCRFA